LLMTRDGYSAVQNQGFQGGRRRRWWRRRRRSIGAPPCTPPQIIRNNSFSVSTNIGVCWCWHAADDAAVDCNMLLGPVCPKDPHARQLLF
jgi:hypothetical protein